MQSRYYDPEVGRFINADGYINANGGLVGNNLYAYCNNNPVNYVDQNGEFAWLIVTALVLIVPVVLSSCTSNYNINGIDESSPLYNGKNDTLSEAVDEMSTKLEKYLSDDSNSKEAGGFIYKLQDGYYVSTLQSGILATEYSIKIDITRAPKGAEIIATFHSHPYHNDNIIFTESEYRYVVDSNITSYVVDRCGCLYALYPNSDNYMDYVKIK